MQVRLLLEISLRLMGVWFVLQGIESLTTILSIAAYQIWGVTSLPPVDVAIGGVPLVVRCLLGVALIRWAPTIADRFCPLDLKDTVVQINIGAGDVYHVACFVLAVYLLVQTVQPASRVVAAGIQGVSYAGRAQMAAETVTAAVHAAVGLVLLFGARRIGELLSNLRYDPDTVPKQQFSLRMLLVFLLLIGIVLGIIRIFTADP